MPVDDPPPRDELMLKVLMAIEHGPEHALDVITRQRTALLALLQQRRREGRTTRPAGTTSPPPSSPTRWWSAPKPTCAGSTSANPASPPQPEGNES